MTRDPKRPELVDVEARRAPAWSGGSRTTEAKERIRAHARRRAAIVRAAREALMRLAKVAGGAR